MTDVLETDEAAPDEAAADDLTCPDCGEGPFASKLLLGAHRFHKHGIKSQKAAQPKGRKRTARTESAGDAPESGRQARRRKAVKETLIEMVSFTDEARGRSDEPAEDLADVIRRDADKLANSVAWIAEKFTPLGRGIDLLLGHGGPVTVIRGFLGVGRWTLAHWREILQERAAQEELLIVEQRDAEQIAADMERQYLS